MRAVCSDITPHVCKTNSYIIKKQRSSQRKIIHVYILMKEGLSIIKLDL